MWCDVCQTDQLFALSELVGICGAWQLYGHIGRHLTLLTVDRMNVWQAERDNSETDNKRQRMSVCMQALWVLSCMFLPLSVRVLGTAVNGMSSTLDWFENLDKMSLVWKLPIYEPSSQNFRGMPVPSKSKWKFVATNGSEVEKPMQAKWHLAKGCLLAL